MSQETALLLLQYPNLKNLLEAVLTIEESILQSKIVEDPQPLKGKKTAEVLYPDPIGTIAYPATEFITLEEARRSLQTKVSQVFWQVDRKSSGFSPPDIPRHAFAESQVRPERK